MTFFELPGTEITDIPLIEDGFPLSLLFIEIGCDPNQKRSQLRKRQMCFAEYWEREYRCQGIAWYPSVRRLLAHYDPFSFERGVLNCEAEYNPDIVLYFQDTPPEVLDRLDIVPRQELLSLDRRTKGLAEEMIRHPNPSSLHELIISHDSQRTARLRGKFAEMIALNTVQDQLPEGCTLYRNSDIRYFHDTMSNGTEVDGLVVMYGDTPFWNLVERMRTLSYLTVEIDRNLPR